MIRRQKSTVLVVCIVGLFIGTSIVPAFSYEISEGNNFGNLLDLNVDNEKRFSNNLRVDLFSEKLTENYNKIKDLMPRRQSVTIDGEDWDIVVPDDYSSIQKAIDHALDGDHIFVRKGTYKENLIVNKERIMLRGENRDSTYIVGDGQQRVIYVEDKADGINILGFTIKNSGQNSPGIHLLSDYNVIQNNIIQNNGYGLKLIWSSGNVIRDNTIDNNQWGIFIIVKHHIFRTFGCLVQIY